MTEYQRIVDDLYADAAGAPMAALCCTQAPTWRLPGLRVPQGMLDRNSTGGSA